MYRADVDQAVSSSKQYPFLVHTNLWDAGIRRLFQRLEVCSTEESNSAFTWHWNSGATAYICSCGRRIAHHVLGTTSTFPKSYKVVSHVLDGLVPWRNIVHVRCTYTVRDDDTRERLYVDVPAESVLCMRFAKKGSLSWSDGTGCPFASSSQHYELPCKVSSDYLVGLYRLV